MRKTYETLIVERADGVDRLTLNRPRCLNALSTQMVDELLDYFNWMMFNDEVRLIVMTGAGRGFCSGFDIKEDMGITTSGAAAKMMLQRRFSEVILLMTRCPQPIVALVNGTANGGGFSLALAADIRLAGRSARMNAAYIRMGFSGTDMGSSYFLPRYVGLSNAAEILMSGRFVDADRALRIGLVSEVFDDEELVAGGNALVADLLQASALGLQLTKQALRANADAPSVDSAILLENRNQILSSTGAAVGARIEAFQKAHD